MSFVNIVGGASESEVNRPPVPTDLVQDLKIKYSMLFTEYVWPRKASCSIPCTDEGGVSVCGAVSFRSWLLVSFGPR